MTARLGLELEYVCTRGDRFDLAADLAAHVGGGFRLGLKHIVDAVDERPRCTLTQRAIVVDAAQQWVCDVVDDVTLAPSAETLARTGLVGSFVCDDVRIAKWWESRANLRWRDDFDDDDARVAALWVPLLMAMEGEVELVDDRQRGIDRWGQVWAVVSPQPASRLGVAEVVLAPQTRAALPALLQTVVSATTGCTVLAPTSALHVHLDAAPFRESRRLARLIVNWNAQRDALWRALRTNTACTRLGPFPAAAERVAQQVLSSSQETPFAVFAAALRMAGCHKAQDINLTGVLETHPVQPTLEVRCLPMSLDVEGLLASVDAACAAIQDCVA